MTSLTAAVDSVRMNFVLDLSIRQFWCKFGTVAYNYLSNNRETVTAM